MKTRIIGFCAPKHWNGDTCGLKNPEECRQHASYKLSDEDRAELEFARYEAQWSSMSLH
jgi:hypothetical protein